MKKTLRKQMGMEDTLVLAYNMECGGTATNSGCGGSDDTSIWEVISCVAACVGLIMMAGGCT